MSDMDWPAMGMQAGAGLVVGLAVGYAVKKTIKVALFVIGVAILAGVALEHYGFITINWTTMQQVYDTALGGASFKDHAIALRDTLGRYIPITGGFGIGFLWGLKRG